jgi:diaminohydroxyphosphoribosylaminopyrimidine deaminase/5-amino-6-(5-phosphoribosylamino)uracil reductase
MGPELTTSPDPDAIAAAFHAALGAAQAYEGATAPNPPVGCAILDSSGRVLAIAAHQRAGGGHAEVLALAQCREKGVVEAIHTLVVTLEPCNHFGRTPPCSQAIIGTPAKAVWIGAADPNPRVAGGGIAALGAAGIRVCSLAELCHADAPALASRAARLIAPFAKRMRTGLPWVTVKQALNADGSMVPPAGSKTFTSPAALALAHQLRRRADAILTGSGTILADAPLFTVRHVPDFAGKARHLVMLDRRGRISDGYIAAARERGFIPTIAVDPALALRVLGEAGVLEVLVEAGPKVTASILGSPFWDEHVRISVGSDGTERVDVIDRIPISPSPVERI